MARPTISAIESNNARDEDRDGDVAALQLRGEVDLGREPVDDSIAHVHQHDAERGVNEVQRENRQLHEVPS